MIEDNTYTPSNKEESTSFSISDLPKAEYAQKGEENKPTRKVFGIVGENGLIRRFDPNDLQDMERARILQDLQQQDFFLKETVDDADLRKWLEDKSSNQEFIIWAVAGSKEKYEKKNEDEIGEVQGWIYANPIEHDEVQDWVQRGLIAEPVPGQEVIQLAYARLPGAESGQMASAARVVCASLAQLDASLYDQQTQQETKVRLGLDPEKTYDEIIEGIEEGEKEAFKEKYQQVEDEIARGKPHKPTLQIVATISPRNPESMRVAESAGFVRKQEKVTSTTPDLDPEGDYLYVLDWDNLQRIGVEKATTNIKSQ